VQRTVPVVIVISNCWLHDAAINTDIAAVSFVMLRWQWLIQTVILALTLTLNLSHI